MARLLKEFQDAAAESFSEVEGLQIKKEAKLLVEIEDIHDELSILRMVLKDQQAVTNGLSKLLDPGRRNRNNNNTQANFDVRHLSTEGNRLLENHLERIDTMERMTQKTSKTVCRVC